MDILTLYVTGYFLLAAVAMILLDVAHNRMLKAVRDAHERSLEALTTAVNVLGASNVTLLQANQQAQAQLQHAQHELFRQDLSAFDDLEIPR